MACISSPLGKRKSFISLQWGQRVCVVCQTSQGHDAVISKFVGSGNNVPSSSQARTTFPHFGQARKVNASPCSHTGQILFNFHFGSATFISYTANVEVQSPLRPPRVCGSKPAAGSRVYCNDLLGLRFASEFVFIKLLFPF